MPRSVGITVSAVLVIIASVFTILVGAMMVLDSVFLSKPGAAANIPANLLVEILSDQGAARAENYSAESKASTEAPNRADSKCQTNKNSFRLIEARFYNLGRSTVLDCGKSS